ncbi:hypothetical protein [Bartonella quintana]|uniref:Uncharacterized protein n=3 Tax=Bartonella quintana TaxID=803 RepID=A0A0H3LUY2_BARQU|nr:hypothetical protein [Bartonella quintana]ETS12501.1 hypothetical protein Q651_00850 [Bartonella quintana BQ2-D70]ETS14675.1 hypothetical protein Q650_00061 [Bartonella quintana JK 73rel]ETS17108.1 hypothetical protein Q649_00062 [Bartonella quintana JK 73]ETS17311.1 hypothetical protein Q648_00918 [Bartonella quintana JK 12]ETS19401.1 hypothetical protein Q647_00061 [Bartonella quintana JK 7]
MNIRYFFIAGAITSCLAVAFQESDRIVIQQPEPVVAPLTVPETDLKILEPTKGTVDNVTTIYGRYNPASFHRSLEEVYNKGINLLDALFEFIHSVVVTLCMKLFS